MSLARIKASSRRDELIDSAVAVELATKACELTGHNVAEPLDVLAMAHAAAGDFQQAVSVAQQAEQIAKQRGDDARAEQIRARIELYGRNEAYRM